MTEAPAIMSIIVGDTIYQTRPTWSLLNKSSEGLINLSMYNKVQAIHEHTRTIDKARIRKLFEIPAGWRRAAKIRSSKDGNSLIAELHV